MSPAARKLADRFSYEDYYQWDEGKWELIDGVVYDMSPAPSRRHQKISGEFFAQIHSRLTSKSCEVYAAPFDVRLADSADAADDEIFTVVQPDIVVVCDQDKLDDRGCAGAPDLVIEILSPSTAATDLKIKRDLYEKHGVREYWLVHPIDNFVMAYRLETDGCYQKAAVFTGEDEISSTAVPEIAIKLEDIFGKPQKKKSPPNIGQNEIVV